MPWLPAVLALSVNSPYLAGVETDGLSARAERLLELPRGGAPPRWRRSRSGRSASRRPAATTRGTGGTSGRTRGSGRSRCGSPTSRRASSAAASRSPRSSRRSARGLRSRQATTAQRSSRPARGAGHLGARRQLHGPPEALRQLEVGRREGSRRSRPISWDAPRHEQPPFCAVSAASRRRAAGPAQRPRRPGRARDRRRRVRRLRRPRRLARRAGSGRRAGGRADSGREPLGAGGLVRRSGAERRASARARAVRAPRSRPVGARDVARPLPRDDDRRDVRGPRRSRGARELGDGAVRAAAAALHRVALRGAAPARPGPAAASGRAADRRGRGSGAERPRPLRRLPRPDRQRALRRRGEPRGGGAAGVPPAAAAAALPRRRRRRARRVSRARTLYRSYAWVSPLRAGEPRLWEVDDLAAGVARRVRSSSRSRRASIWSRPSRSFARRRRRVVRPGAGSGSSAARRRRSCSRSRCWRR